MAKKVQRSKIKSQNLTVLPGGKLNNFLNNFSEKIINYKKSKTVYIILIIAGVLLLAIYKKSWFVAATVNGLPITNLELQMRLNSQYRNEILDVLITEQLVLNEAAKNNITITEQDIEEKFKQKEENVGGKEAFDASLAQQGLNRNSIKRQVKLLVALEKLYASEATVSAQEVSDFIPIFKSQLRSTDSAKMQKEAEDILKTQKISQIFWQKLGQLRSQAKIQIF